MRTIPVDEPVAQHESVERAPLPTRGTLRRRRNLCIQAMRFVSLNVRMGLLAMRGHR